MPNRDDVLTEAGYEAPEEDEAPVEVRCATPEDANDQVEEQDLFRVQAPQ